jgi:hypothetical protein
MNNKTWIVETKEDPNTGDAVLEFPPDLLAETGWKEGDALNWKDNGDGSFTLTKIEEKQWVLVDCISTFRTRYMVEVPVGIDGYGNDKTDWALDTVTCNDAKEFSQQHLGEQIVSHRAVTKEEALLLCDKDNSYAAEWGEESKVKNFFTTWEDIKK